MTMNKLCDEPNPLGDEILFYSSDGTESYKKVAEASRANARSGSTCCDKVIPERSSEVGSENGSENGSEKSINRSGVTGFESTSTSDTSVKSDTVVTGSAAVGDSEGEGEVLSVRQHLKFFQAYEEEADNLANDYADRLRMSHNIGEI